MFFQKKGSTANIGPAYEATVKKIGSGARDFLGEKMVIFFGDKAPDYLAEYCFILGDVSGECDVCTGDTLKIGDAAYRITAIGDVAIKNLIALGHLVVKFDGAKTPAQPGTMHVEENGLPSIDVATKVLFTKTH